MINHQLRELYETHLPQAKAQAHRLADPAAAPLLIRVDEEQYKAANLKVLYCGKETDGWGTLADADIDERLDRYHSFFGERNFPGRGFWRGYACIQRHLEAKPGVIVYPIWSNVSKIGRRDGKGMTSEIRALEREHFPVFRKEVCILQPDIIVFMSGPSRDDDILFHYRDREAERRAIGSVPQHELAEVCNLGCPGVRTYHPGSKEFWQEARKRAFRRFLDGCLPTTG